MNAYITLNGTKFRTPEKNWRPSTPKPGSYRNTLLGDLDVTYGSANFQVWEGEIEADVTPDAGFGSVATLRSILSLRQGITFVDHYGGSYTVHAIGTIPERSFGPKWDAPSNKIYFQVRLVGQ